MEWRGLGGRAVHDYLCRRASRAHGLRDAGKRCGLPGGPVLACVVRMIAIQDLQHVTTETSEGQTRSIEYRQVEFSLRMRQALVNRSGGGVAPLLSQFARVRLERVSDTRFYATVHRIIHRPYHHHTTRVTDHSSTVPPPHHTCNGSSIARTTTTQGVEKGFGRSRCKRFDFIIPCDTDICTDIYIVMLHRRTV